MAEFIDISQFTSVIPSGTEEIQISATQKTTLLNISKLSKPDDVPTYEEVNDAITSALNTFETQKVDPLVNSINYMKGNFIALGQGASSVELSGGDRVWGDTSDQTIGSPFAVTIKVDTFDKDRDYAILILPKSITVTFSFQSSLTHVYSLKNKLPDPDTSSEDGVIVYTVQLLDKTSNLALLALNGADYTEGTEK